MVRILILTVTIGISWVALTAEQDPLERKQLEQIAEIELTKSFEKNSEFLVDVLNNSKSEKVFVAASNALKCFKSAKVRDELLKSVVHNRDSVIRNTWIWYAILGQYQLISDEQVKHLLEAVPNDSGFLFKLAGLCEISANTRGTVLAHVNDADPADIYQFIEIELGKSEKYPVQKPLSADEREKDMVVLRKYLDEKWPRGIRLLSGSLILAVGDRVSGDARKVLYKLIDEDLAKVNGDKSKLDSLLVDARIANEGLGRAIDIKRSYNNAEGFINEVLVELNKSEK